MDECRHTKNIQDVTPSTQKLVKSLDLKVEYFETLVSMGVAGGHDMTIPPPDEG